MTQYYLPPTPPEGMPAFDGIIDENYTWIPNDEANSHWVDYQAWVAEGNTAIVIPESGIPAPALPPTQPSP